MIDALDLIVTRPLVRMGQTTTVALRPGDRALVEAYVAGVNAHLASLRSSRLPIEFAILRVSPEPWRAEDVLAWQKVMGWSMSTNWREELLHRRLAARVGEHGASALLPASAEGDPLVLPDFELPPHLATSASGTTAARAAPNTPAPPPGTATPTLFEPRRGGSNNWVVSGARTVTGKPFLANDPHLATQAPAVWYVAHLRGGPLDVIGATLPGAPAVVIGHNQRIAWGVTNMMSDVQDLFAERINDRDEVEVDGAWAPMRILYETIPVLGSDPVRLRVRLTRHGPLISDLFDERVPLALRWTGHDTRDRTAAAFLRLNRAQSWDEFLAAFEAYHLPMLNFVFADTSGNIGYAGPGALPIRSGDGRAPAEGWHTPSGWQGYVPTDHLPRALNPARGFIASANNKVVPGSYPYSISTSWEAPYRAARIAEVLGSLPRASMEDMKRLQTDQRSLQARRLVPFLLRASPQSAEAAAALARLKSWDRTMAPDSAGAALYKAFAARATWRLFSDDLGPTLWNDYRLFPGDIAKVLDAVASEPASRWCDDVTTTGAESCSTILGEALEHALEDLRAAQGGANMDGWRWDRQNEVWFPHLPFQASRPLRPFFSRKVRRGGDGFTVNPSMPARDQILVASYRQLIDLADFDRSQFILPLGQSGQLLSGRYDDLLDDWNRGQYRPLRYSAAAVDAAARETLRLEPVTQPPATAGARPPQ